VHTQKRNHTTTLNFSIPQKFNIDGISLVSKKIIAITAVTVVVISVIAATGYFTWQTSIALGEVENVIRTFLNEINAYDAFGAWGLTTEYYQSLWLQFANFKAFIDSLNTTNWHTEIQTFSNKTIETENGKTTANFTVTANVVDDRLGTYVETWIFELEKISNLWKIANWRPKG